MGRYVRQPRQLARERNDERWLDEYPLLPSLSVSDHEPVDTGLVWPDGTPVYRSPNPIGFGRTDEW
jgi:hypothetical protein